MLKAGTITLETNQAIPITPRDDRVYLDGSVGGLGNQPSLKRRALDDH